ncbi:MAG: helix-hairpin-helix domain-containing protein [bacterium]
MTFFLSHKRILLLVCWALYGVFLVRFLSNDLVGEPGFSGDGQKSGSVLVSVAGEVWKPGTYLFDEPSSVMQAIQTAGGPTGYADLSRLNLSAPLVRDSVLRVPCLDSGFENVISLNRSSALELVEIPGIGPELAARIVRYREENGPFKDNEDLLNVHGIGKKKLRQIMEHAVLNEERS